MSTLRASLLALAIAAGLAASLPAFAGASYRKLAPGVAHGYMREATAAGPMVVHVLRADPRQVAIRAAMATHPRHGGFGRATPSAIARALGAIAAVNGSFFNYTSNEPAGLVMLDGQLVASSPLRRSVFGIRYDGTCFVDDGPARAAVLLDSGREIEMQRVNRRVQGDRWTLYTSHYGRSTRTPIAFDRYEVAIDATGLVIEAANGDLPIPPGGSVVSAAGAAAAELAEALAPGDRALVYNRLPGVWEGVRYAIGGGPTIVRGGRAHVTARQEGFDPHVAAGRAPRTAIGYTRAGEVLMVTVDGRKAEHSVGCTLNELARLMIKLGATEAMNLDGGGSSTMVVDGKAVNRVSAGKERDVSNVIGIFAR